MKKLVKVEEVQGEGFLAFLGENIMVFCLSYIYAGKLTGVNDEFIKLEDAKIVYETGDFSKAGYTDAQKTPNGEVYLMKKSIESFCAGK